MDNPSILPVDINKMTFLVLEPESRTINSVEVALDDVFTPEVLNVTNRRDLTRLKKLAGTLQEERCEIKRIEVKDNPELFSYTLKILDIDAENSN